MFLGYLILLTLITVIISSTVYIMSLSENRKVNVGITLFIIILFGYGILPSVIPVKYESIPYKAVKMHYNPITDDVWAELRNGDAVVVEHSFAIIDTIAVDDKRIVYKNVSYTTYGIEQVESHSLAPKYQQ